MASINVLHVTVFKTWPPEQLSFRWTDIRISDYKSVVANPGSYAPLLSPAKSAALLQLACLWWWGAHCPPGNPSMLAQLRSLSVLPLLFNWDVTCTQQSSLKPFPDHKVIFPVLDKNEIKQWYSFVPGFFPSTLSLWKQSLLWYIPEICSCSLLFSVHLCEKTTLSIYPFCCWLPLVSSLGLLQIKTSFKFLITSLDEQSTLLLGIYLGE